MIVQVQAKKNYAQNELSFSNYEQFIKIEDFSRTILKLSTSVSEFWSVTKNIGAKLAENVIVEHMFTRQPVFNSNYKSF